MNKKLINEDIKNMKYLLGYKPGRVISEQEPPNNTGYWTRTTTMDTPMSQDDKEEEQTSNSPSIEKQTSNSPSIDERIKSLYGEWLSQKSNNVNNDITYIGGNLESSEDMLKILQILKSKGWPLCIINGNLKLKDAISLVKKIEFIKEVHGDVIIWNTPIESLGSIEYIQGDLLIYKSGIKTLGNLVKVHGGVLINEENLSDLGMLKSVGKRFELVNCKPLESLGDLEYIGGFLDISNTNVSSFGKLKSVGSYVDISYTPLAKKYNEHMIRTMFNMKPNRRVTAKSRIIKEQEERNPSECARKYVNFLFEKSIMGDDGYDKNSVIDGGDLWYWNKNKLPQPDDLKAYKRFLKHVKSCDEDGVYDDEECTDVHFNDLKPFLEQLYPEELSKRISIKNNIEPKTNDPFELSLKRRLSNIEDLVKKHVNQFEKESEFFSNRFEFADSVIDSVVDDIEANEQEYSKLHDYVKDNFGEYILSRYTGHDDEDFNF
jgi:hypothetical protein